VWMQVPQMPVWMRVGSRNLIAVLSARALLTPSRVLPAKFSILARCALALPARPFAPLPFASRVATAGATPSAHRPSKEAAVLVVLSVGRS